MKDEYNPDRYKHWMRCLLIWYLAGMALLIPLGVLLL